MQQTSLCFQPHPSAVNVTLPAFAAERAQLIRGMHRRPPLSISVSYPQATAAAVDRRDRQTDGQTDALPLHRPCSACYAGSVNNEKQYWLHAVDKSNSSYLRVFGIPSPTHSFIPGLKPSFSVNPSHRSLSFSASGFTTWIPQTVYCYF